MNEQVTAVVPLKAGLGAKRRLAHRLSPNARAALARALCEHVTGVLSSVGLEVVVVATEHTDVACDRLVVEPAMGLNAAMTSRVSREQMPVLVCVADLPWLTADAVRQLLSTAGDIVVAPTGDGGTGGLLLRRAMPTAFGRDSGLAHAVAARRAGLGTRVVSIEGFASDLDDETSLARARGLSWVGEIVG